LALIVLGMMKWKQSRKSQPRNRRKARTSMSGSI